MQQDVNSSPVFLFLQVEPSTKRTSVCVTGCAILFALDECFVVIQAMMFKVGWHVYWMVLAVWKCVKCVSEKRRSKCVIGSKGASIPPSLCTPGLAQKSLDKFDDPLITLSSDKTQQFSCSFFLPWYSPIIFHHLCWLCVLTKSGIRVSGRWEWIYACF